MVHSVLRVIVCDLDPGRWWCLVAGRVEDGKQQNATFSIRAQASQKLPPNFGWRIYF
jgi:hypothetical protein